MNDAQVLGSIEHFMEAVRADTTGFWEGAPRLDRWLWLARLAAGPYPNAPLKRLARDILKRRRPEQQQLREEAFRIMSRNEALAVMREGVDKAGPKKWNDAQFVMTVSDAIRRRKVGAEPYVLAGAIDPVAKNVKSVYEIQQLHMRGGWLELPSVDRARMIKTLRKFATNTSKNNVRLRTIARTILVELNVPLKPPAKFEPERKNHDDKTTDRLIAAFHGIVARQMNVVREKLVESRLGTFRVSERQPARLEAALRLVEAGEAILLRDAVETPRAGRVAEMANERTPRRVVVIAQTESTRTAPEDML